MFKNYVWLVVTTLGNADPEYFHTIGDTCPGSPLPDKVKCPDLHYRAFLLHMLRVPNMTEIFETAYESLLNYFYFFKKQV